MRPVDRQPLNVLMVAAQQSGGGAGRAGELLSAALQRDGHTVHSFVRDNLTGDPTCRQVRHWRVAPLMKWLHARGLPELGNLTALLWRARAEFAAADVLHLHNLHGEYISLAALPLWALDKPIVWTLHDFWPLTGNCATPRTCTRWQQTCGRCPLVGVYPMTAVDRSRFYRWLKPRLFSAARARLITPSRWLGDRVREIPALRGLPQHVIRYPIDCDLFAPQADRGTLRQKLGLAPERPTVVLSGHGWSDPFKGGDQAVTALRAVRVQRPQVQLLVIGQHSADLLAATGLRGAALPFLAGRQPLAEAYACADLLLFPSRAENYPLTVLEAMACGTPAVAYDVGGVQEQIDHLRTGFVARDGHADELAAGILRLLSDLEATRRVGRLAREFVLRTSAVPVIVTQYLEEYGRAVHAWSFRRRRAPRFERGPMTRAMARVLGWETPGRLAVEARGSFRPPGLEAAR